MRILVTGATGLLGWEVAKALDGQHEVVGWARGTKPCPVPLQSVDLTDESLVYKNLIKLRPQVVINCAALVDVDGCELHPDRAYRFNRDIVAHLARASDAVAAHLFAVSTDYVFEGTKDSPYREEDATHPVSVYGRTKLEGEKAALGGTRRSTVVRVSALFGAARLNLVTDMVDCFKKGKPVLAVNSQRYSPSYSRDVAEGIRHLVDRLESAPRIVHVTNAEGGTRYEVAQYVARVLGFPPSLIHSTTWQELGRPARRPAYSQLDCTLFARTTQRPLRSWREALSEFLTQWTERAA